MPPPEAVLSVLVPTSATGRPRPFHELIPGAEAIWRHRITEVEVDACAALSGDVNPLHLDELAGRRHGFRGRVVPGMLLGGYLSRVLGTELPGPGCLCLSQSLSFERPAYPGDNIEVRVRVMQRAEALRTLVLETTIVNGREEVLVSGEAKVVALAEAATVPWTDAVAVVTGGSRGIGAAIARELAQRGARVVVSYRERKDAARAVVADIRARGGFGEMVRADLALPGGAGSLAAAALDRFGRVDMLVNNATPAIRAVPALELNPDELDGFWRVYVRGTLMLVQALAPGMRERRFGRIVNVLSSYVLGQPPAGMAAYVAAKSALWGLTRALAAELAADGITVNAVSPSPVATEQWADASETRLRALAMRPPRRRLATPEDVARAVTFLCDSGADFVTGINVPVAGGEAM